MSYRYRDWKPGGELGSLVDAFWINEPGADRGQVALTSRILPDGCIDLVFSAGKPGAERLFSSALVEEPAAFGAAPGTWFVGARFRPAMSELVLDVAPAECRGRNHDAVAIDPSFAVLAEQLAASGSPGAALHTLRREVERRVRVNAERRRPPARIRHALALLMEPMNRGALRAAAREIGISERTLHRDLVRWTGLSPKLLARIFRMQHASRRLAEDGVELAEVALESGYADQAHMTRELRRLTGETPARLRRHAGGGAGRA